MSILAPQRPSLLLPSHKKIVARRGPEILIPNSIELGQAEIEVKVAGVVHGYEVVCVRTGRVKRKVECGRSNLIVDAGLDALGSTVIESLVTYGAAGTGSTAPTPADTTLQAEVHRTNNSGGFASETSYNNTDPANPFHYYRKVFLFPFPAVSTVYAEVGLFQSSAGGTMFARSLIKDATGSPTTIAVQPDEQLKLYYEWRIYPSQVDILQTISATIRGVATSVDYTFRVEKQQDSTNWGTGYAEDGALLKTGFYNSSSPRVGAHETNVLVGRDQELSGTRHVGATTAPQGIGYIDVQVDWALTSAVFATGIGSFSGLGTNGGNNFRGWQILVSPKIDKTSADTLSAGFKITYNRQILP